VTSRRHWYWDIVFQPVERNQRHHVPARLAA
jgi:hypothetical protein